MRTLCSLLFAGLLAIPMTASAWIAVAVAPGTTQSYTQLGAVSKSEAEEAAVLFCSRDYNAKCKLILSAPGGNIVLVYSGKNMSVAEAGPELKTLEAKIKKSCQAKNNKKPCELSAVAWDAVVDIPSYAIDSGANVYITKGHLSEEESNAKAMSDCKAKAGEPDSCKVLTVEHQARFVRYTVGSDSGILHSRNEDGEVALKNLMDYCAEKQYQCTHVPEYDLSSNLNAPKPAGVAERLAEAREIYERNMKAAEQKQAKANQALLAKANRSKCSNSCHNGACVRTFSNGAQETWQAPWVYNPATNNWEWDINTNACGSH